LRSIFGALNIDGAAHDIDNAAELDQQPIPHGFDQPAVMFYDPRREDLLHVGLKTCARSFFIDVPEVAIAGDIGNQYSSEPALYGLAPMCRKTNGLAYRNPLSEKDQNPGFGLRTGEIGNWH
jgi:hypothetical protein